MAQRSIDSLPEEKLGFDELYRKIQALPQGTTGEILTPGTLKTMGRPGWPHQRAAQRLFRALRDRDRSDGGAGWWFGVELELRLARKHLVVPDISGWRVERCAEPPSTNPITLLPDWVCEVHSPSTRSDDRHLKLPLYARVGIPHIWLVDPETRLVEVYVPSDGQPKLVASAIDDDAPSLAPFDVEMPLTYWWKDPPLTGAEK